MDVLNDCPSGWIVIPDTMERSLVHRKSGRIIHFSDDLDVPPHQDHTPLREYVGEDEWHRLRAMYSPYEIESRGF